MWSWLVKKVVMLWMLRNRPQYIETWSSNSMATPLFIIRTSLAGNFILYRVGENMMQEMCFGLSCLCGFIAWVLLHNSNYEFSKISQNFCFSTYFPLFKTFHWNLHNSIGKNIECLQRWWKYKWQWVPALVNWGTWLFSMLMEFYSWIFILEVGVCRDMSKPLNKLAALLVVLFFLKKKKTLWFILWSFHMRI